MRPVPIAFALLVLAGAASAAPTALVRTRQGWLQGFTSGDLEQFRGVPYAAPPIGALRFRPPEQPKAYSGVLQATSFSAPCAQARVTAGLPPPSEDCLYLNVWRPANSFERKDMPVLVYIHGGGFGGGSGAGYDGAPVAAANDMVVVTINYRLSVFGWLANASLDAETADASSGNYGFLDMLQALRWIHDNIRAFGGNPEKVTIAGTSAGGIAMCALITAPIGGEKLFDRAILESAECTHTSAFIVSHATAMARADAFAAKLGCTDKATAATCLRSLSQSALLAATTGLPSLSVANVGGALLAKHPIDAIPETKQMVPVIVGANHDETRSSVIATTGFPGTAQGYTNYLNNSFGANAPLVAAQYPLSAYSDPAYAAGAASSDSGFPSGIGVCPMLVELGAALAQVTKTYAYELNDPDAGALSAVPAGFQVGSEHGAEMKFLYNAAILPTTRTPDEGPMTERMLRYWGGFLHNGDPDHFGLDWPRFDKTGQVLRFEPKNDVLVSGDFVSADHRCAFWKSVGF